MASDTFAEAVHAARHSAGGPDALTGYAASSDVTNASAAEQAILSAIADLLAVFRDTQNVIPYARDVSGQMRVNTGTVTMIESWAAAGVYANYYASGAPASMDMREIQEELSLQTFNAVRNGRWVFS